MVSSFQIFMIFLIKRIYAFHFAGKNASLKIGGEPLQRLGDSRLKIAANSYGEE